jgi:hypothetical protein
MPFWTVKYRATPENKTGLLWGHSGVETTSKKEAIQQIHDNHPDGIIILWARKGDHMPNRDWQDELDQLWWRRKHKHICLCCHGKSRRMG